MAGANAELVQIQNILRNFNEGDNVIIEAVILLMAEFPHNDYVFREYAPWVKIFLDMDGWRRLPDPTFETHFRMSRALFNNLLNVITEHLRAVGRLQRDRGPLDIPLMMTVWILSNKDTMRGTAIKFGVSPGVLFSHYAYLIEAIRELAPKYIQWPTPAEREETKRFFQLQSGYPGIVGAIDGTHIEITSPKEDKPAYINRNAYSSITVQAVVDHKMLVRDMHVGEPGSLHDARIFRRSPLSTQLLVNPLMLSEGEHLVGDGAYGLSDKLLSPYEDNQMMNPVKRHHNYCLSSCRSIVERAFGLCKGEFRRLKQFEQKEVVYTVDAITSCFVLNNYIWLNGEALPPNNIYQNNVELEHDEFEMLHEDAQQAGEEKRDNIAAYLYRLR